jgi:hypothetical protein
MKNRFNSCYDPKVDYIPVTRCALAANQSVPDMLDTMTSFYNNCDPFHLTGCWFTSASGGEHYRRAFAWRAGLADYDQLKSLARHDGVPESKTTLIIRHHPLHCELLPVFIHHSCCRPSHLALGNSVDNGNDVQRRLDEQARLLVMAERIKQAIGPSGMYATHSRCVRTLTMISTDREAVEKKMKALNEQWDSRLLLQWPFCASSLTRHV